MKRLTIVIPILLLLVSIAVNNASAQRQKTLDQAVVDGDIDRVKTELAAGVDINTKNRMGWTLLHIAINKKHTEIIKLLIEKGADVNIRDNRGRTPVMLAAETGQKDIVEALIAKGAALDTMDSRADNALTLARKNNHPEIAELLQKHGAKEPDLSSLQSDRMYSLPGGQQGANNNRGGSYQARARSVTTTQSAEQMNNLADPNEIKKRIKTFDGLEKELKVVEDKSQDELRHWPQSRYDNRTTLARSIDKQVEEELQYVRNVAVKESAKKTTEAIDDLLKNRKERYTKVNREILQQKRETKQAESMQTGGRGRATARSTRGQYSQRDQSYGANTANSPYDRDALSSPRGPGSQQNPGRQPEQPDPQTEEQIRLWLETTPENKLELVKAINPMIQSEMSSIRAIAEEEKAKKTTAAIDGLMLARQQRYNKLVVTMEQEQRKLQEEQNQNMNNNPDQAYQQRGRYSGRTRRGMTTQGNNQQQQSTRRGRRR